MDLISRQDAINIADAVWSVTGDKNVAKVWDQIKDLPSAQPERKKGKWIIQDGLLFNCCDECKSAFGWWADSQTSNYCPELRSGYER